MKAEKYIVLSASRMTDMPGFYPHDLMREVETRLAAGKNIHSLVLWTKHPSSLLRPPLHCFLTAIKKKGIQLFFQLTITGMGQRKMGVDAYNLPFMPEPHVPEMQSALATLPDLVDLAGHPGRLLLRIDPVIRIRDARGSLYSNLDTFECILAKAAESGISRFTFSFLEKGAHAKVNRRFQQLGIQIESPNEIERQKTKDWMTSLATKYKVRISSCCVPEFMPSACLDGHLLQQLHDQSLPVTLKQPKSRPLCGCTSSVDIGGWPPKKCASGCVYCYANPVGF